VVNRGKSTYPIRTDNIGKTRCRVRPKRLGELKADLSTMKGIASGTVKRLLTIVGNWAVGTASPKECLSAIEAVVRELSR
jgi:hypothetical protein